MTQQQEPSDGHDWVARTADTVLAEADLRAPGRPVVCASGISPSGPIHLGNLRELMVPHLVADEIRRRGRECVHLLSWDDYDRLRRVPAGMPREFAEHVGRPLSGVPDPDGGYPSWAERFKAPVRAAMAALGIEVHEISQTERYTSGAYTDQILRALDERARIDAILGQYRTKERAADPDGSSEADPAGAGRSSPETYYPYKAYCHRCGRDTTGIDAYDRAGARIAYTCASCDYRGEVDLRGGNSGKLVWKADWPMRWAYEHVTFEPAGADHSSPGSSFTVGSQIVRDVYGAEPPVYLGYAFVGGSGMAKMSSSTGGVPTPVDALRILEAPILRWLYTRRLPSQAFTIGFGAEVTRLYDEWDRLRSRVADGTAASWESVVLTRSTGTAQHALPAPEHPVPFRVLASLLDITGGDDAQLERILRSVDAASADVRLADVEPRLGLARAWVAEQVPASDRTHVRTEADQAMLASLAADDLAALELLLEGLAADWSLDGLTRLVYSVPKLRLGLTADAAPTPEVKQAQKSFFRLLYRLLVGAERGPRLPTLLLSIGEERVRALLGGVRQPVLDE